MLGNEKAKEGEPCEKTSDCISGLTCFNAESGKICSKSKNYLDFCYGKGNCKKPLEC